MRLRFDPNDSVTALAFMFSANARTAAANEEFNAILAQLRQIAGMVESMEIGRLQKHNEELQREITAL